MDTDRRSTSADEAQSASDHVRELRLAAGLTIDEVASAVRVDAGWLATFERGERVEGLTYDRLLALVRACQPPRPEWWDEGHEHDLHLGPEAVPASVTGHASDYWERIEAVRVVNRSRRVNR